MAILELFYRLLACGQTRRSMSGRGLGQASSLPRCMFDGGVWSTRMSLHNLPADILFIL